MLISGVADERSAVWWTTEHHVRVPSSHAQFAVDQAEAYWVGPSEYVARDRPEDRQATRGRAWRAGAPTGVNRR
jgi:hypothetical protein